jgi:diguanylate cyclase
LKKADKLPFPLYYKEVFNKIAYDKNIIDSLNPKLLLLNKTLDEKLIEKTQETMAHINEASKEIKSSTQEIVEEIEETDAEEVKEIVIKYSADLINKINKMEHKIRELESELDKAYKELLIDPLTKVYNRKALEKDLKELLKYGKDKDLDLIVAIVDVDDFKHINDRYGHLVGDFVLVKLAQIMKSMIRNTDKIYRYGGDEFIIVFNRATLISAEKSIERIIHKISRTALKYKDELIKVTISVGIAEHRKGDTIETLIKKADDALYRVKSSDKNGYNTY